MYKYQEDFVQQLASEWLFGDQSGVRTKIRALKNKAQAAYIAAGIAATLHPDEAAKFVEYIHPNN